MSPAAHFRSASVLDFLRERVRAAITQTRRGRSTWIEVFQLEERALMSGTPALGHAHGSSLPAHSTVAELRSATLAASAKANTAASNALTPIQRLAWYDPSAPDASTTGYFVPVTNNDKALENKDIYVLVHGWAPGYIQWVKNYEAAHNGSPLKWWQTIPEDFPDPATNPTYQAILALDTGKDKVGPESPWLLEGYSTPLTDTLVSASGMAQDIMNSDPNAAVLAYSWLDDSATRSTPYKIPVLDFGVNIPRDAYLSEAMTTVNGERLAMGLEQALGPDFNGKLQLIGHSHGSKVATVAADALSHYEINGTPNPIHVSQLTLLDSPESDGGLTGYTGATLAEIGAANDNWYYLQDLRIRKTPSSTSTFVDNYISALDEPYHEISYKGAPNTELANVVDVNLLDLPDISNLAFTNTHSYAAYWYAA
jgi:hypothetical protein